MNITNRHFEGVFNVFKESLGYEISDYFSKEFSDISFSFDSHHNGIKFLGTNLGSFEVSTEDNFDGTFTFYVFSKSRKISVQRFDNINTFLEFLTNPYWVSVAIEDGVNQLIDAFKIA